MSETAPQSQTSLRVAADDMFLPVVMNFMNTIITGAGPE